MTDRGRTLVLLRHAKSGWPDGVADAERPLAERGRRDAGAAGAWFAAHLPPLDLVLCSPAVRARETWRLVADGLPGAPPVEYRDELYGASAGTLTWLAQEVPAELRTVALVGHNPGMTEAVTILTGRPTELKTCSVAVLTWPGAWTDLTVEGATLAGQAALRSGPV
jgi:phosphohistidine phosphatase